MSWGRPSLSFPLLSPYLYSWPPENHAQLLTLIFPIISSHGSFLLLAHDDSQILIVVSPSRQGRHQDISRQGGMLARRPQLPRHSKTGNKTQAGRLETLSAHLK
jgi:hypothetical protein